MACVGGFVAFHIYYEVDGKVPYPHVTYNISMYYYGLFFLLRQFYR